MPTAASNAQSVVAWHARPCRCARCFWRGDAALELSARARLAALPLVSPCAIEGHYTVRGCSPLLQDRNATCQPRPSLCAAGFHVAHTRVCNACICRARAPYRAGWGRSTSCKRSLHRREASFLRCKAVMRRASRGLHFAQPAFTSRTHECATLAFAARARRTAQVGVALRPVKDHCTGGRPLSFGVRPWCDVPAEASTLHSRLSRRAHASAQHLRLSRALAAPRKLGSLHAGPKNAAPAGGLSASV